MHFCLGPMSKNIVDTIVDYSNQYGVPFTFIPSRRQIDFNGGYVNHWTTKEFYKYVKTKNVPTIRLQRDHGGPGQGTEEDDGITSIEEDVLYMDSIHIDPWKKYPEFEEGLQWTVLLIKKCYALNPLVTFEIGTEESIRPMSVDTVERLCVELKTQLTSDEFNQIKFLVIQCGTLLLEKQNIGHFDEAKLEAMLSIAKKYGLEAKEHNGDWVAQDLVIKKEKLGLHFINIAPELGEIETKVILEHLQQNPSDVESFYQICFESGRWKKWVSSDFIPEQNKERLILISGHYVFTDPTFLAIKSKYQNIDSKISKAIVNRLNQLTGREAVEI
jgi:D-tagatose-1,6-bisphosphate aldolase subunit GatZ/KbaZ